MSCAKILAKLVHLSDAPHLVDVAAMDDRTSDLSVLTVRRADFRERLINRDRTCVISGEPVHNCTACHIIPHSKGNDVRS